MLRLLKVLRDRVALPIASIAVGLLLAYLLYVLVLLLNNAMGNL